MPKITVKPKERIPVYLPPLIAKALRAWAKKHGLPVSVAAAEMVTQRIQDEAVLALQDK